MRKKPLIAITMGDPSGIGPEIILRALRRVRAEARFIVLGSADIFENVGRTFKISYPRFDCLECFECPERLALAGRPTVAGGRAAAACISVGVQLAAQGRVDALVTAPISKEGLNLAGFDFPGHTEMIATALGVKRPVMMMAADDLRVALVTTHVAVAELPRGITKRAVLETIRTTDAGMRRRFRIDRPRIAVCGLNPHAGEAGLFGREEKRAIVPAIRQAILEGILCEGPFAADSLFVPDHRKRFDAIVAMYHDQACIPVKMLGFNRGVNVTLGLPIIRVSPDHGTAYGIVQKGIADPGSMVAAIRLAIQMAAKS